MPSNMPTAFESGYKKKETKPLQIDRTYKLKKIVRDYQLYLLILPAFLYIVFFKYMPMYGLQIAFKNFRFDLGFAGSPWVGFHNFERFFHLNNFSTLIINTAGIAAYELIVGFPIPIILALMINETVNRRFKKFVQMVTYAPHFISVVVMVGILMLFLHEDHGLINNIIAFLGGPRIDFLNDPAWFKTTYVFSGIWQNMGWGTIIYLAALSTIDHQLVESSKIDGANRLQKIWHVDLPGIAPTITILFILNIGHFLDVGFQKVLLMQNQLNIGSSDIISTYVYRVGILGGQFSYTTAIGMFNSIINFILLIVFNQIARKRSEVALW